jgi:hypothetical protein
MTDKQVMEIMESLGLHEGGIDNWVPDNAWVKVANAVEAAERESCAQVCEALDDGSYAGGDQPYGIHYAKAIRARGQG